MHVEASQCYPRALRTVGLIVSLIGFSACGGSSPLGPSAVAQVAGAWSVTTTVTSASGGECFAPVFQSLVGTRATGTLQIQQNGSQLTATAADASSAACTYTGTAGADSVALTISSCTGLDVVGATCPDGAGTRNIRLKTGGIDVSPGGTTLTGTSREILTVTTTGGSAVGTATLNYAFSATKR